MATVVSPGNQTVSFIRATIRELTASPGENQLTTAYIDQTLNNFVASDFPNAIKTDQMRNVYSFFTVPYQNRYPLDVNYDQSVRAPVYIDGYQGYFYKDREEFFRTWPKWPTLFNQFTATSADPMMFNFTIPGPILSGEVTIGGTFSSGAAFAISDDGFGNLYLQNPNPITSTPASNSNPAFPGMYNINNGNPGLLNPVNISGTVNYITGQIAFTTTLALAAGTTLNVFVNQYQTGRPYSLLFWNNYFEIRPIPKLVHKITVETYLTPVQFMLSTDNPILMQWAQYLAYGSSIEILRRRQDMAGVQNLMEGFKRQEALVLERQANEEINQRNKTLFSDATPNQGWNANGFTGWF